jgi:hypothetical protein
VLAARDGSGRYFVFQARSGEPGGSLVLSNSPELLEAAGCSEVTEFQPGAAAGGSGS